MVKKKIKVSLSQFKSLVVVAFLVILSGGVGFRLGRQKGLLEATQVSPRVDLSLFWQVWKRLEDRYLDSAILNSQEMVYGAVKGMVASLGDPYTAFFSPRDNEVNKEDLNGEFGGVGIQLGYRKEVLAVISPLDNTPAFKAGIKAGDLILKVKDENKNIDQNTDGMGLPEAVKLIRGKEGTSVLLTLLREEGVPFEVELVRSRIVVPSLTVEWLQKDNKKIAYVHLLQFSEVMYQQWENWVEQVVEQKQTPDFGGVVLDLRNNPGGFLEGAVYITSEFVAQGVVVKQKGVDYDQTYQVNRVGQLLDVPLVVLANQGSASAAEILAGALQHYQRAKVVGEQTFGKGTIQEPENLPDGSGLHITVARWFLPGDTSIDKQGVRPDIEILPIEGEEDVVLEKGMEILLE